MANYLALATELALPEYGGLSDDDVANHYNGKMVTTRVPVISLPVVLQWAGAGPLDSIDAGQSFTSSTPATQRSVRAACKAAIQLFSGSVANFDLDSPSNRQLMGVFVAAGLISLAEQAGLLALGDVTVPLYASPGGFGHPVTGSDIHAIRN